MRQFRHMDMPINIQLYTAIWASKDMDMPFMLFMTQSQTSICLDMDILIMSLGRGVCQSTCIQLKKR